MNGKYILLLFFLLTGLSLNAQLPTDFRSEQVYLNPEKHTYLPGDTIALEGIVTCLSEKELNPYSNYVYVELFNGQDSVLLRQKLSCKRRGYFSTRMVTEYEWPAGIYYLRAYTQFMRNFSPKSFPIQPLLLGKTFPQRENRVYEAKCALIPAGKSLVSGYPQTVIAQLTDEAGFPVQEELYLTDDKGDTLSYVRTSLSGMAQLRFIPQQDVRYTLVGKVDGIDYEFPLPKPTTSIKVQGSLNGQRLNYQLLHAGTDLSRYRLYVYDRENGLSELASVRENGIIQLEKSPAVLSLFLTEGKEILSEYTVTSKYRQTNALLASDTLYVGDTLSYRLTATQADTRVMVRVITAEDRLATYAEGTLNYLSDYTSSLAFPASFYACTEIQRGNDLQSWLSAATFKRFQLFEAVEKDTSLYQILPEQVLEFSGTIEKKNGYPMKNGTLLAYRSDGLVYDTPLDDMGRFRMAVDDFTEGEEFFLQAMTSKGKPDFALYQVDDEEYPPVINPRPYRLPLPRYATSEAVAESEQLTSYKDGDELNYVFPNITVKARLQTEEVKETNAFYQTNFADRKKIEEKDFRTLYDILMDMPGITVRQGQPYDGSGNYSPSLALSPKWTIQSNRGASVLSSSQNNLPIIVDNTRYTEDNYDILMKMPAFEIEQVEFLRPWQTNAYTYGAINGAIMVITRDFKERPELPSKGVMYQPTGLIPSIPYPNNPWKASAKGIYRLIVDVFTPTGIQSYEHQFEVVEN